MTPREAFRVGFLSRCAENGCTPAEVAALVDRAAVLAGEMAKDASWLGTAALTAGIGIPIGVGALGGYMSAKSKNEDVDVDEVKREELLREYKRLTREAQDAVRRRMTRAS